jgi:hypothetical protein
VLDLAELVADHQLLNRRQDRAIGDRLDEIAVARVGRDAAGGRVRMRQQPGILEVGQDVPDGRARHAKAVALDKRSRPDWGCAVDVFLDDGSEDRLGSGIQRASGADAARHERPLGAWRELALTGGEC